MEREKVRPMISKMRSQNSQTSVAIITIPVYVIYLAVFFRMLQTSKVFLL